MLDAGSVVPALRECLEPVVYEYGWAGIFEVEFAVQRRTAGFDFGIKISPACASNLPDATLVFENGAPQCEPAVSLDSSASKLLDAGVDVLKSSCGTQTGVGYASVCGGLSGELLVHEIHRVDLPEAERLGFQEIDVLVDAGTGYRLAACTGNP